MACPRACGAPPSSSGWAVKLYHRGRSAQAMGPPVGQGAGQSTRSRWPRSEFFKFAVGRSHASFATRVVVLGSQISQ